jgi:hypothetical protein
MRGRNQTATMKSGRTVLAGLTPLMEAYYATDAVYRSTLANVAT